MSDNQENLELETQAVEPELSAELPPENSVEAEARRMGWKPKDEFGDNPSDWVSAEAYIARGPMIKQIKQMKKSVESLVKYNQNLEKRMKEADLNGYNRAISELKTKKEFAIDDDEKAYYENQIQEKVQIKQQLEADISKPAIKQEAADFAERNKDWFLVDQRLTQIAIQTEQLVKVEHPEFDDEEVLLEVENRMKSKLPKNDTRKPAASTVAPVSQRGSSPKSGTKLTVNDLNEEAKSVFYAIRSNDETFTVDRYIEQAKLCNMDQDLLRRK
jgi:hypothetical protein